MLNNLLNKKYFSFYASFLLFISTLVFSGALGLRWDSEVDVSQEVLEINLPVIDWAGYLELSKQADSGTLNTDL